MLHVPSYRRRWEDKVDWYRIHAAVKTRSAVLNPDGTLAKCYLDVGEPAAAYGSTDGKFDRPEHLAWWDDYDFSVDEECRNCQFAPVCLGGCPKQNASEADKRIICTPLKFNFHQRMRLQYAAPQTAVAIDSNSL